MFVKTIDNDEDYEEAAAYLPAERDKKSSPMEVGKWKVDWLKEQRKTANALARDRPDGSYLPALPKKRLTSILKSIQAPNRERTLATMPSRCQRINEKR